MKYILAALAIGVVAGYLNNNFANLNVNGWVSGYLFDLSLLLLLFVMGFKFAVDREAVTKLKKAGVRILVVPLAIALGSTAGGLVGGYVLGVNVFSAMAISAGFGWYTLAGPLVGQLLGTELGALGFAVNFLRELLTIVTVPLTAKLSRYAPVAIGGATAMDTTLPVIMQYSDSEVLITAFSSGFTLTLIAPFTITAIATLT